MPEPRSAKREAPVEEEEEYEASSGFHEGEDEYEDDFPNAVLRALVTDDGESVTDVLKGIQTSLAQQAKVMYKMMQMFEKYQRKVQS